MEYNIPDNSYELNEINKTITIDIKPKVATFLDKADKENKINEKEYEELTETIKSILFKVGALSIPIFNLKDIIREEYTKKYIHSPELGRKLWLDEYSKLHKPYNLIKNTCFNWLDSLEEKYILINKKKPILKNRITINY